MDKEDRERIKEIKEKYGDNRDVGELLSIISGLEVKLFDADILAMAVDEAILRKYINPRSQIADARLNYGEPYNYQHLPQKLMYLEKFPKVKSALEEGRES